MLVYPFTYMLPVNRVIQPSSEFKMHVWEYLFIYLDLTDRPSQIAWLALDPKYIAVYTVGKFILF